MPRYQLESYPIAEITGLVTPAALHEAFQQRGSVWSGADNLVPTLLPDGSVVFYGGDTWVGGHRDGYPNNGLVRNTLVKLKDGRLTAWFGPDRGAALRPGTIGTWLWPAASILSGSTLKILSLRMKTASGPWGFQIDGYDFSRLDLPSMAVLPSEPAPCSQGDGVVWSGSAVPYCGAVYIYGWRRADWGHIVARTTSIDCERTPWVYWTARGWTDRIDDAEAIPVRQRALQAMWVIPYRGAFYGSTHLVDAWTASDIHLWRSDTPIGPFEPLGPVASIPVPPGTMSYAGRVLQAAWCGADDLIAVHSTNGNPGTSIDVRRYGPTFAPVDRTNIPGPWHDNLRVL